jgi:hypothetical protein
MGFRSSRRPRLHAAGRRSCSQRFAVITLLRVGLLQALPFISEGSRLPVLLPVRQADRLASKVLAAVSEMLAMVRPVNPLRVS